MSTEQQLKSKVKDAEHCLGESLSTAHTKGICLFAFFKIDGVPQNLHPLCLSSPLLGSFLLESVQSSLCLCVMLHQQAAGHTGLGQNRKSCISLGGEKNPLLFVSSYYELFVHLSQGLSCLDVNCGTNCQRL